MDFEENLFVTIILIVLFLVGVGICNLVSLGIMWMRNRGPGDEKETILCREGLMTQLDLSFTRPRPEDLFKPGSQNCRLLGKLFDGPITNDQIVKELHILKYTGRISEVREAVRPYLMDIEAQRMPGTSGQWVYQLKG